MSPHVFGESNSDSQRAKLANSGFVACERFVPKSDSVTSLAPERSASPSAMIALTHARLLFLRHRRPRLCGEWLIK
jgi:hypothetical protein